MRVTFVSSFVPRKCGIATYTRDLSKALKAQKDEISVIAMENPIMNLPYSSSVVGIVRENMIADYKRAALMVNDLPSDIIHIQHEFGLFGGEDGIHILEFAKRVKKPLITTFHTVHSRPSENQKYILQKLAELSTRVTVMEESAKYSLKEAYGIDISKVKLIRHGAPDITMKQDEGKRSLYLAGKFVLLSSNLIGRDKGLEYAIRAVKKAAKDIPNLIFLIVGETHPVIKHFEGESYRKELVALVKKLDIGEHVVFKNKYVSLEQLKVYFAAADICITPYLNPQQITSGVLSYAVACGKPCISSKYAYANHMLSDGRGMLVPFRDARSIAAALVKLYKHPHKRTEIQKKLEMFGEEMSWPSVAKKHVDMYNDVLLKKRGFSAHHQFFLFRFLEKIKN